MVLKVLKEFNGPSEFNGNYWAIYFFFFFFFLKNNKATSCGEAKEYSSTSNIKFIFIIIKKRHPERGESVDDYILFSSFVEETYKFKV